MAGGGGWRRRGSQRRSGRSTMRACSGPPHPPWLWRVMGEVHTAFRLRPCMRRGSHGQKGQRCAAAATAWERGRLLSRSRLAAAVIPAAQSRSAAVIENARLQGQGNEPRSAPNLTTRRPSVARHESNWKHKQCATAATATRAAATCISRRRPCSRALRGGLLRSRIRHHAAEQQTAPSSLP